MLTPEQLQRLEIALYGTDDDDDACAQAITALATTEELHAFAAHFNWDDDIWPLLHVARHPLCDRGTALMIYWNTNIFDQAPEHVAYATEVHALAMEIERRFVADGYSSKTIRFDPRDPADLGGDWRLAVADATREVPAVMFEATPGARPVPPW